MKEYTLEEGAGTARQRESLLLFVTGSSTRMQEGYATDSALNTLMTLLINELVSIWTPRMLDLTEYRYRHAPRFPGATSLR